MICKPCREAVLVLVSPFGDGRSGYSCSILVMKPADQLVLCLRDKVPGYDMHCHWLPERVDVLTPSG